MYENTTMCMSAAICVHSAFRFGPFRLSRFIHPSISVVVIIVATATAAAAVVVVDAIFALFPDSIGVCMYMDGYVHVCITCVCVRVYIY